MKSIPEAGVGCIRLRTKESECESVEIKKSHVLVHDEECARHVLEDLFVVHGSFRRDGVVPRQSQSPRPIPTGALAEPATTPPLRGEGSTGSRPARINAGMDAISKE